MLWVTSEGSLHPQGRHTHTHTHTPEEITSFCASGHYNEALAAVVSIGELTWGPADTVNFPLSHS